METQVEQVNKSNESSEITVMKETTKETAVRTNTHILYADTEVGKTVNVIVLLNGEHWQHEDGRRRKTLYFPTPFGPNYTWIEGIPHHFPSGTPSVSELKELLCEIGDPKIARVHISSRELQNAGFTVGYFVDTPLHFEENKEIKRICGDVSPIYSRVILVKDSSTKTTPNDHVSVVKKLIVKKNKKNSKYL